MIEEVTFAYEQYKIIDTERRSKHEGQTSLPNATKSVGNNKRKCQGLSEEELAAKLKEENRERKQKWRQMNKERNKDNDLRCRVNKRANKLFGPGITEHKQRWIIDEFRKRQLKRKEKEHRKALLPKCGSGSCQLRNCNTTPASLNHTPINSIPNTPMVRSLPTSPHNTTNSSALINIMSCNNSQVFNAPNADNGFSLLNSAAFNTQQPIPYSNQNNDLVEGQGEECKGDSRPFAIYSITNNTNALPTHNHMQSSYHLAYTQHLSSLVLDGVTNPETAPESNRYTFVSDPRSLPIEYPINAVMTLMRLNNMHANNDQS